jgi:GntR family histidine utilization transcriptional repressor
MTTAPQSLHQRILSDLQGKILSGKLTPGTRIATEHELAEVYDCSRMTVSNVLAKLARAGLVERRRKAGTFVRRPQSQAAVLEIHDMKAEVEALGLAHRYELVSRAIRRSSVSDRERLGTRSAGRVVDLVARHFAGDRVFCLEERVINVEAVPDAVLQDFGVISPGRWLLDSVPWTAAEHRIASSNATRAIASALAVKPGTACLVVQRRTWRAALPVTHVRLTYPGDLHQLVARFTPASA